MSGERPPMFGVNGAQTISRTTVSQENVVESVQRLYDLLGAAKIGKNSEDSVYLCGVLLRNTDGKLKELEERIKALEGKAGGNTDG